MITYRGGKEPGRLVSEQQPDSEHREDKRDGCYLQKEYCCILPTGHWLLHKVPRRAHGRWAFLDLQHHQERPTMVSLSTKAKKLYCIYSADSHFFTGWRGMGYWEFSLLFERLLLLSQGRSAAQQERQLAKSTGPSAGTGVANKNRVMKDVVNVFLNRVRRCCIIFTKGM